MSNPKTIEVKTFYDPAQLKEDLNFSGADLSSAMMAQASLTAHYGVLAAKAARQLDNLELVLEVTEAKVYRKLRDEAVEKVTEAQLAKLITLDSSVIAIKKAVNEARQVEASLKTAVEAFKQRRDMLIQLGAQARAEMEGEVSISRRAANAELADAQRKNLARVVAEKTAAK